MHKVIKIVIGFWREILSILIILLIAGYVWNLLYPALFEEKIAKENYRNIKNSLQLDYEAKEDEFLVAWEFFSKLPEIQYLSFEKEDSIKILLSFEKVPDPYWIKCREFKEIVFDSLIISKVNEIDIANIPIDSVKYDQEVFINNSSDFSLVEKDGVFSIFDSEKNDFIKLSSISKINFSGTPQNDSYKPLLNLIGLKPEDVDITRQLIEKIEVVSAIRKDRVGNVYLEYYSVPCEGTFEYVFINENSLRVNEVIEFGCLNPELGLFWQYGFRDFDGCLITFQRNFLKVN